MEPMEESGTNAMGRGRGRGRGRGGGGPHTPDRGLDRLGTMGREGKSLGKPKSPERRVKSKDKIPKKAGSPTKGQGKRSTAAKAKVHQKESNSRTGKGENRKTSATDRIRQGKEALKTATAIYASIFRPKEVQVKLERLEEAAKHPPTVNMEAQEPIIQVEMDIEKDGIECTGVKTAQETRGEKEGDTIDLTENVPTKTINKENLGTATEENNSTSSGTTGEDIHTKEGKDTARREEGMKDTKGKDRENRTTGEDEDTEMYESAEEEETTTEDGHEQESEKATNHKVTGINERAVEAIRKEKETEETHENAQAQSTPTKPGGPSYAEAASTPPTSNGTNKGNAAQTWGQTVIRTHTRRTHKYSGYMDLGIMVERECHNLPPTIHYEILRETLVHVFKRAKEVDSRVMMNPYYERSNLPTIMKVEDIPTSIPEIKAYIPHIQMLGRNLKKGRNNGYRVNLTFTFPADEFVHLWELTRREYLKVPFVYLRFTPMQQSTTYHTAGYFINSSEKQCTDYLRSRLEQETGEKIGIDYRPAAADNNAQDVLWREAKAKAAGNKRDIYKHAPLVQQVYSDTRDNAQKAATKLTEKYGKQQNGHYPRLPDGTRMKFVPAAHFLDMKSKQMSTKLLRQQIGFQTKVINTQIPIKDPQQVFTTQDNKTMQELILDITCDTMDDEPYFRHIAKRWTRDFAQKSYEVSIHSNIYHLAAPILRNLKDELTKRYGKEVGDAIGDTQTTSDEYSTSQAMSAITIETEDRYMNGKGRFIITGMENIAKPAGEATTEEEERTMNVKSLGSDQTGRITIGSYQVGTADQSHSETRAEDNTAVNYAKHGTAADISTTEEEGWSQIGTADDRKSLHKRMNEARTPTDGKHRGHRP